MLKAFLENRKDAFKIKNDKIIVNSINEYEDIISCYKTLNDEHKSSLKLFLDHFYQMEQKDKFRQKQQELEGI